LSRTKKKRYTADQVLSHRWLVQDDVPSTIHRSQTLAELSKFNARRKWKAGRIGINAISEMVRLGRTKSMSSSKSSLQEIGMGSGSDATIGGNFLEKLKQSSPETDYAVGQAMRQAIEIGLAHGLDKDQLIALFKEQSRASKILSLEADGLARDDSSLMLD